MDIKNNGSACKRLKGFTLVELIIVIAIIVIVAGISFMTMTYYIKNAKLETLNDRARLVFDAFQDMLIDCETSQDNSMFEPRGRENIEKTDDIIGAVIFFRVSQFDHNGYPNVNGATGLGDEIHVMTTHEAVPINSLGGSQVCSRSVWADGSTNPNITNGWYGGYNPSSDHGAWYWDKFNQYISAHLDASATGTYVVSIDLENYQVLSVICRDIPNNGRDPKTGLYDAGELADPNKALGKYINYYCGDEAGHELYGSGAGTNPPQRTYLVKDTNHQKDIANKVGVDIGAYPFGNTFSDKVENPMS